VHRLQAQGHHGLLLAGSAPSVGASILWSLVSRAAAARSERFCRALITAEHCEPLLEPDSWSRTEQCSRFAPHAHAWAYNLLCLRFIYYLARVVPVAGPQASPLCQFTSGGSGNADLKRNANTRDLPHSKIYSNVQSFAEITSCPGPLLLRQCDHPAIPSESRRRSAEIARQQAA
jgi:hypothetical protein